MAAGLKPDELATNLGMPGMSVFLSWSGEASRQIAEGLHKWLPLIFDDIEPWMSGRDIHAGSQWGESLTQGLRESTFGILCLTKQSLSSHWLIFEAGALSKGIATSKIVPYRFQLKAEEIQPPLSQFQGVDATEPGTWDLVVELNNSRQKLLDRGRLEGRFKELWPSLQKGFAQIDHGEPKIGRSDRDLLEELVGEVRNVRSALVKAEAMGRSSVAAFQLLAAGKPFSEVAQMPEFRDLVVAWSAAAPDAQEMLQGLPLEKASQFVAAGYSAPKEVGQLLSSMQIGGDLGSSDPRDKGHIHGLVEGMKRTASPYLLKALESTDPDRVGHAAYLLGLTGDSGAVGKLTGLLSDVRPTTYDSRWPRVCDAAESALKKLDAS